MQPASSFYRRHPLLSYYLLAFVISWGGILLLIGGPGNIPAPPDLKERLLLPAVLLMLLGPSVAGLLMTGLLEGRAGLRDLGQRLLNWRAGPASYALALLLTPALIFLILLVLSRQNSDYLPGILATADKPTLLLTGIGYGLAAGIFEELGWSGFVLPRMRRRLSLLGTGLVMGFLWGAWHYLVNFWGSGNAERGYDMGLLLPSLLWSVALLPAFRVLMVWLYERSASLPLMMLMHASLTGGMLILNPLSYSVQLSYSAALTLMLALCATLALASLHTQRHSAAGSRPGDNAFRLK